MQKRGNIAVFLVVLFIAAIGVAVILSGPSTTGMYGVVTSWWDVPASLPDTCGAVCMRSSDCSGNCPLCSPSLGRCIGKNKNFVISGRFSWSNFLQCQKRCNTVKVRCDIAFRSDSARATCASNQQKCIKSCDIVNIPKMKTEIIVK